MCANGMLLFAELNEANRDKVTARTISMHALDDDVHSPSSVGRPAGRPVIQLNLPQRADGFAKLE